LKSISFIFLSSCKSIDFIILFFFGKLFLYVPFRLKNTWTAAYDSSVKKLSSYFLKKCILRRNLLTGNIFWYNLGFQEKNLWRKSFHWDRNIIKKIVKLKKIFSYLEKFWIFITMNIWTVWLLHDYNTWTSNIDTKYMDENEDGWWWFRTIGRVSKIYG